MRHRSLLVLLLLLPLLAIGQHKPYWALGFGSIADDRASAVAIGPNGTVYVVGTFSGLFSYPGGNIAAQGVTDVYLARLDTSGAIDWLVTAGGPGAERATDVAVDANGNAVITGQFSGSMLFGGTDLGSNGPSQDIFLARYGPSGVLLWARAAGSPANVDIGEEVTTDAAGNIYVAGEFSHTAQFGALQVSSTYDPSLQGPGTDLFLAKYNAAGDPLWVKKGAASHTERVTGLAANANGDLWLAGQFNDTLTFDVTHPNSLNNVGFVAGFGTDGSEHWFRRIAGGGEVALGDLCVTGDTVWLAGGQSGNNLLFSAPPVPIASSFAHSAFVLAFSSGGELRAQRTLGSDASISATSIDVRGGEVLLGGPFECVPTELAQNFGGEGILLSWGLSNGWMAVMRRADLSITYGQVVVDASPMDMRGLALGVDQRIYAVGEYSTALFCPAMENQVHVYGGDSTVLVSPGGLDHACSDTTYYDAISLFSQGQRDAFVLKCFMRDRSPFDVLVRPDTGCVFDLDPHFTVGPIPGGPMCEPITADVAFCGQGAIQSSFEPIFGPTPTYLWNTGFTQAGIFVSEPGAFSVDAVFACKHYTGGVTVEMCAPPSAPGITDSEGVNFQDTTTTAVTTCLPTLVTLTAGPLPADTFYWQAPGPVFLPDTTVLVQLPGLWVLTVEDSSGCTSITPITINYIPNEALGPTDVQPAIVFEQDDDHNDTIVICSSDVINVFIGGTVVRNGSPMTDNGIFNVLDTVNAYPIGLVDQGVWQINNGKGIAAPYVMDGWYVFDVLIHIDNSPCRDEFAHGTVRDSVYVIGLPSAQTQIDIIGSIFLCSGDTVHLTTTATVPGHFQWVSENGGIVGSDTLPTLDLVQGGLINVTFTPTDTTACAYGDSDAHSVQVVSAPSIGMDPADGLICPGGSVTITVGGAIGSYTWYGPGGLLGGNTASLVVQQPGVYFCVVNTSQGCHYATALQTVSLYSTPSLIMYPEPVLCAGGSVEVVVQPTQNADYAWLAPLTGNTPFQTITQPGTYGCQVTQCGVTTSLMFDVTLSTVNVGIVDPGPFVICPGDSVQLNATDGNAAYVWQPGDHVGQTVHVSEAGAYSVIAFNDHGCSDTAGVVVVDTYAFNAPLTAHGDTVCAGTDATALANGSGTITWYTDPGLVQQVGDGATLTVPGLVANDTVYVVQEEGVCTSLPFSVVLAVFDSTVEAFITGDSTMCIGDTVELMVHAPPGAELEWQAPLSGSAIVRPVVLPGSYSCRVALCGDTLFATFTVHATDLVGVLDHGPFNLCEGDSVVLQAEDGYTGYAWLPGSVPGQNFTVTASGSYAVMATDSAGCTGLSEVVVVSVSVIAQPVQVDAPGGCVGSDVSAEAQGSGSFAWYADAALQQPIGSSPVVTLPGLTANDTIYVVQSEGPCTGAPLPVLMRVDTPPPVPLVMGDTVLCAGDTVLLGVAADYPATWATPSGTFTGDTIALLGATVAMSGAYAASYLNGACAGPGDTVDVLITALPVVDLGPDLVLCQGGVHPFNVSSGVAWQWSTGSIASGITVSAAGLYVVHVIDAAGCANTDSVLVTVDLCDITIPNVITPNGDGVNDVITLEGPFGSVLDFRIFNRWGQLIFQRNARVVEWDGREGVTAQPVSDGTYFYVLRADLPNDIAIDRSGYIEVRR